MARYSHNWTYWLYNFALHSAAPALVPYFIHRLLIERKSRGAVRCWMGDLPMPPALADGHPRLWIHAVSVGEVMAAHAIVAQLRKLLPDAWILITTVTDTGQATACQQVHEANAIAFLPLDFPWAVRRALERVHPSVVVLIEGELWPNLIHWARLSGSRLVLANGRISDATLSRAQAGGKAFYQCLLAHFDLLAMRSELDGERIIAIGAPRERVVVTGDVKLDVPHLHAHERTALIERLRKEFGLEPSTPVWVAGSTHPGEEELILEAYTKVRIHFPTLRLIIAPRHIERTEEVTELIQRHRFWCIRRTALLNGTLSPSALRMARATPVYLLDTMGELKQIYALATVAFVGGSLIPRGGHNVVEPILHGRPVIFGPHVDNFRPHAAALRIEGVGFQVNDVSELTSILIELLSSSRKQRTIEQRAIRLIRRHRGAAERTAQLIRTLI